MIFIFWFSALSLVYVYGGYGLLLQLWAWAKRAMPPAWPVPAEALPAVSVLLTVHNEAGIIARRLDDLLAQNYPKEKLQIIVASDGSTDATDNIVAEYAQHAPVHLVRCERLGKSGAQNVAMLQASGEIVLFTDAQTRFAADYIRHMAAPFAQSDVGCVTAQLLFESAPGVLSEGQGYYWNYELRLRVLESRLGCLAVASGQAMAVRRSLFRLLPLNVGEDCIVPLDVALQGYKIVHQSAALAYDVMETEAGREFNSRVRMVMRNWTGTWMRPSLLNPLATPAYALALWSHKLLRWLGGIALVLLAATTVLLSLRLYPPAVLSLLFFALAVAGALEARERIRAEIPFARLAYSFVLVNMAFLLGLCKVLMGQQIIAYRAGQQGPAAS